MTTWTIEVTKVKGAEFPWRAAIVGSHGKRMEAGEFLDEKEAQSYAAMEMHRMTSRDIPQPARETQMA